MRKNSWLRAGLAGLALLLFVGPLVAQPTLRLFRGKTLVEGELQVITGDLVVGNGTPGVTQNGEDAYVEGTLEVDGAATFDGNVDATVTLQIPNGSAPAATCSVGEIFLDTDETVDTNCTTTLDNVLCVCGTADTWKSIE